MKSFDEVEVAQEEVQEVYDKYTFQKQRLLLNLTRNQPVIDAIWTWLLSFEGGISKTTFDTQISKLDFNDEVALDQLKRSIGKRYIAKQKKKYKELQKIDDVLPILAEDRIFIAVSGGEMALRKFVRNTYQSLKNYGNTFVLDLHEMILKWEDKYNRGNEVDRICSSAMSSDFLIIIGQELPITMQPWVLQWFTSLKRYRIENKLPIIMLFGRYMEKDPHSIEHFELFSTK